MRLHGKNATDRLILRAGIQTWLLPEYAAEPDDPDLDLGLELDLELAGFVVLALADRSGIEARTGAAGAASAAA